ncbi:MAG TPA: GAF domain-containing SpoIIE family protein phosphatase [Acidimicrobiales bacterium]|nr:GAF domain-containing SpoIIE family protein phosphatase [Acidimicrobiales bacterium]
MRPPQAMTAGPGSAGGHDREAGRPDDRVTPPPGTTNHAAILQAFTEALNAAASLDSAVQEIVASARSHLGVGHGSVVLLDERGAVVALHSDPVPADASRLLARLPSGVRSPSVDAVTTGAPVLHATREEYLAHYPALAGATEVLGAHSFAHIPLMVGGRAAGVLALTWLEERAFLPEDRELIVRLGEVSAAAVQRAQHFERTAQAADALQRAVLPSSLPTLRWATAAARYLPSEDGILVGGDWYDAFEAPGGGLWVTVGDVGGHGVAAAAAMAQLRAGVRAACFAGLGPAAALDLLDRLLDATEPDTFATAVIAALDPSGSVVYASAGHPPPIIVTPGAPARRLEDARRPLLGLGTGGHVAATATLPPASTLLLYTDGLIERRGEILDVGIDRVVDALGAVDVRDGPGTVADRALASSVLAGGRSDDVCVLAVRHLIR